MQLKAFAEEQLCYNKEVRVSESTNCTLADTQDFDDLEDTFVHLDRKRAQMQECWGRCVAQTHVTPQMVTKLVDWMLATFWRFDMSTDSIFLSLSLLRAYLKNRSIEKTRLQALGLTCILIASKYSEVKKLKMEDTLLLCHNIYTSEDIVEMEADILHLLDFDLELPSIHKYYQAYTQIRLMAGEENSKVLFWLQVAYLQGSMAINSEKDLVLEVVSFVLDPFQASGRMRELVQFIRRTEYRYVVKKHLSCFDIDSYLQEINLV